MDQPDAKKHQIISFVKSWTRIGACALAALTSSVLILAVGLAIAEFIGIYEELV